MQSQSFPAQSPYTTKTGQLQGGSHSGQGDGHGHHGPRRLHQQSPNPTTRHQHLQSSPKGSHQPNSKTNSFPFSRTSNRQEASPLTSANSYTPPVQFPPNSMACPKFTKQVHPSSPLFPVGGPSPMVLPRS